MTLSLASEEKECPFNYETNYVITVIQYVEFLNVIIYCLLIIMLKITF